MKRVIVSFYLEPSDPEHTTGLTNDHFEEVNNTISALGGEDIDITLDDTPDQPLHVGGGRK